MFISMLIESRFSMFIRDSPECIITLPIIGLVVGHEVITLRKVYWQCKGLYNKPGKRGQANMIFQVLFTDALKLC
jgi:hypothetical protein